MKKVNDNDDDDVYACLNEVYQVLLRDRHKVQNRVGDGVKTVSWLMVCELKGKATRA